MIKVSAQTGIVQRCWLFLKKFLEGMVGKLTANGWVAPPKPSLLSPKSHNQARKSSDGMRGWPGRGAFFITLMYVHVCDMYVPNSGNISPPTGITKEEDQMSERACLSTKYIKMSCQTAGPKRGKVLPLHLYSVRLLVTVNVYLNLSCALINSMAFKT